MDVQSNIKRTDPTVIITELPTAEKKFVFLIPLIKFWMPEKDAEFGSANGAFIM
jgi:hypothetical protein